MTEEQTPHIEGEPAGDPAPSWSSMPTPSSPSGPRSAPGTGSDSRFSPEADGAPTWTATDTDEGSGIRVSFGTDGASGSSSASSAPAESPQTELDEMFAEYGDGSGISVSTGPDGQNNLDELKASDPLVKRPRISSVVLCVVFALIFAAAAAAVYWFGVHTEVGQSYDDMVWHGLKGSVPSWVVAVSDFLSLRPVIPAISVLAAVAALVIMVVRKRWWLIGQALVFGVLCYGADWLKHLLPRPMLIHQFSQASNSAPSGHTMLAVGAAVVLLMAVPRAWRALVALFGGAFSAMVAVSLVVCKWHRPVDVVMSILIGAALASLALAFTRSSGMDRPGKRVSSASVQVVSSIALTFGLLFMLYGAYVFWNILPGLSLSAQWTQGGAYSSSVICIIGLTSFSFGLLLALRQITASPLSRLGLVGAPPSPPAGADRR